ncbi:MAG: delta-9 desaturase [Planctomyces sp.]|nr:delta-9 desaturase [Planctomyces sp.]
MATELVETNTTIEEPVRTPEVATEFDESTPIWDAFLPQRLSLKNIDWPVFFWMAAMHIGFLAAPFFFTWQAGVTALVVHFLCSSCGICIGFHRYLAHRSFQLKKPGEYFVMICAVLAGQGSPLRWAATHRLHHQRSDKEGDPHSPRDGVWWSHLTWLFIKQSPRDIARLYKKYIPDLTKRPVMQFCERTYGLLLFLSAPVIFSIGFLVGSLNGDGGMTQGIAFLLWALCFRIVVSYHSTWAVNSATHIWGYVSYKTTDDSKNNWWVALMTYGEGWHNNHHAHPRLARAGHRWWEVDISFWVIRLMQYMGLATNVVDKIPDHGAVSTEMEM